MDNPTDLGLFGWLAKDVLIMILGKLDTYEIVIFCRMISKAMRTHTYVNSDKIWNMLISS